jgi:hypothetical protein
MAHEELKKLFDAEYAVNKRAIENWQFRDIGSNTWGGFHIDAIEPKWNLQCEYRQHPRVKEPAKPTYPVGTELTFMQAAEWVLAYGSKAGLEMKFNGSSWITCAATDRTIDTDSTYRVKPESREIITGGKVIEAPEEQKPNNGDLFWTLDVSHGLAGVFSDIWMDNIADRIRLLSGLVYKTEAGAQQRADTLFDFEAVK